VDVVHRQDGMWFLAWKREVGGSVDFRFAEFNPANGSQRFVSRGTFVSSYGFRDIKEAPPELRQINETIQGAAGKHVVIQYLVQSEGNAWTPRYRAGSERELLSGDVDLLTVEVVRTGTAYYALGPGKEIVVEPLGNDTGDGVAIINLPTLPAGFRYTDFWTDDRTLVVSWEQQHSTNVGAAGVFMREIAPSVEAIDGSSGPSR